MLKQLKDYFENQALERKKLTFEEMDERLTTIRRLAHELVNKGPFTSNQIIELLKISSTIDKIRRGELK